MQHTRRVNNSNLHPGRPEIDRYDVAHNLTLGADRCLAGSRATHRNSVRIR
jgi:hypothetical protein